MMDFGPFFWIPIGIGGACILIIIIIIIYLTSHKNSNNIELKITPQETSKYSKRDSDETKKIDRYCPDCGTKLEKSTQEFCSSCGYKL